MSTATPAITPDTLAGFEWHGRALTTTKDAHIKKAHKPYMSPSSVERVMSCPAKHLAETNLPDLSKPTDPNRLGTTGHAVFEVLFDLDPEDRTRERALELIDIEQRGIVAEHGLKGAELVKWKSYVTKSVLGLWNLEDPTTVDVAGIELKFDSIELSNGVAVKGFIDRLDRNADGTITISDYKLGAKVKKADRYGDSYGDQMRTYKQATEIVEDVEVKGARLLFAYAGGVVEPDLSDAAIRKTNSRFLTARRRLDDAAERNEFEATPSALCGWCPLARSCPVAKVTSDKAIANAATKPIFDIPVLRGASGGAWQEGAATGRSQAAPSDDDFDLTPPPQAYPEDTAGYDTAYEEGETVTPNQEADMPTATKPKRKIYTEEKPWEETLANGDLNPASYATSAVHATWGFCFDLVRAAQKDGNEFLTDRRGDTIAIVTQLAQAVGATMLRVQLEHSGSRSWHDAVNTRVRSVVYKALELRPVPFGDDQDALVGYFTSVERVALQMLEAGVSLWDSVEPEHTAYDLLTTD